jgi:uncharacterized protein
VAVSVFVDTGPLVALLDADERNHTWVVEQFSRLRPPLITCEAVLTEAAFLISRVGAEPPAITALVERGVVTVAPLFDQQANAVTKLLRRYANVPMSLAHACLVRLIELTPNATLFTLDSDVRIYRQKGRRVIPLLIPEAS